MKAAYLVLLVALLVTAVAGYYAHDLVRDKNKLHFDNATRAIETGLHERMLRYINLLENVRALFAASEQVERNEFHTYLSLIDFKLPYAGVLAIQYTPLITPANLPDFHARLQADGFSAKAWDLAGGRNKPLRNAREYFPIEFIEPFNPLAQSFDVSSDPANSRAMTEARDTGRASTSNKITLIDMPHNQVGFLMFLPIYKNEMPHETVSQRRLALQGYLVGVFYMHDLVQVLFKKPQPNINFAIYDEGPLNEQTLLYAYGKFIPGLNNLDAEPFQRSVIFDLPGHRWTLSFSSANAGPPDPEKNLTLWIIICGLLASALLFFINWLHVDRRALAERLAASLSVSEASLAYAQQIAHLGNWELDVDRNELRCSDEIYRIFGLNPQQQDLNFDVFLNAVHPDDKARVETAISESVNHSLPYSIDYRILLPNGNERFIHEQVELITNEEGEISWMAGTVHDITERKRAEQIVLELNTELEKRVLERTQELSLLNQELESFSYSVSHDLRAPLRGINGFAQALLEDYGNRLDETGKDYLRRVQKGSQHMSQLIDDLLKLSRVVRSEIWYDKVNLSDLAQEVVADLAKAQPDRQVEVIMTPDMRVKGDTRLLRLALENLLGNAWKFTEHREHAKIEFGATQQQGKPVFFIRDNGAGFDMAYADKMFGAFQRLHGTEFEGTGIGLATVQHIMHRHGGQIWAEGEPGRGATFHFTLPSKGAHKTQYSHKQNKGISA